MLRVILIHLWKNNRFFESPGKALDEATVRKLLSEQVHFKIWYQSKKKVVNNYRDGVSETGNQVSVDFPGTLEERKKNEE